MDASHLERRTLSRQGQPSLSKSTRPAAAFSQECALMCDPLALLPCRQPRLYCILSASVPTHGSFLHRRNDQVHSAGHLLDVCMARIGLGQEKLVPAKGQHYADVAYVEYKAR